MTLTHDQLLAMILKLQTRIQVLENGGGGGTTPTPTPGTVTDDDLADMYDKWTTISSTLVGYLSASSVFADVITSSSVSASNAWAKYMEALSLKCTNLSADIADINTIFADRASITDLDALKAKINDLTANIIQSEEIIAGSVSFKNALMAVANATTLNANNVAVLQLTATNAMIANGMITSAMINSLAADKITSGTLDTGLVTVSSSDGHLLMNGSAIIMTDGNNTTRVQIGKDSNNVYNMVIYDADGNAMWNADGLTADAIKSGLITDSMVASNAAIQASKIDINSVITAIDAQNHFITDTSSLTYDGQSLEAYFSTIDTFKSEQATYNSTTTSSINALNNAIGMNLSQNKIVTLTNGLSTLQSNVTTLSGTVDGISTTVTQVSNTANAATSAITSLQQNAQGFVFEAAEDNYCKVKIDDDGIHILDQTDTELGFWDGTNFHCHNIQVDVDEYAKFGNFKWTPDARGGLAFTRINPEW